MNNRTDVLIIGGGVIGCAIARNLALQGVRVRVLERGEPCREASWAAAGALIARALAAGEDPLLSLKVESLRLFPALCSALTEETGIDSGFRETGGIDFFLTDAEKDERGDFIDWQQSFGIEAEPLDRGDLESLEPHLTKAIDCGVYFPSFTQVRTPWFTRALQTSAVRNGAVIETHTEVRGILVEHNRVVGVRTDRGEFFAETTILAGGPWSTELARLAGKELPGVPVKGQIVLLFDRNRPVRHIVHYGKTYLTPRDEGAIVVGSTEEWVGFKKENTLEGVSTLLKNAQEFYPVLSTSVLERSWCGFRPLTVDGLPYIGKFDDLEGLICATGHYRSGIILAPITAQVVGEMIKGEKSSFDVSPFSPQRLSAMESIDLSPRTDLH